MKKIFLVLLVILPVNIFAGYEDVVFRELDMNIGARAAAMGNVYTGVAEGSEAVFWNTAGIAGQNKMEIGLSYNKWFLDTSFQYLTAVVPLGSGGVGLSVSYMNMGKFDYIDENGYLTDETISPYGLDLACGYAAYVIGKPGRSENTESHVGLSLGSALKFALQDDGYESISAVVLDLGVIVELGSRLIFGTAVQNLKLASEYTVPTNLRIGFSYMVFSGESSRLLLASDFKQSFSGPYSIGVGVEYGILKTYFLRLGYDYQPDFQTAQGGIFGLNGGIGLVFDFIEIDYSATTHGALGVNHTVGIKYRN